jgi:hypothetical protein
MVPAYKLRAAEQRIRELERGIGEDTEVAPHSVLGYRSPPQYRRERTPKEARLLNSSVPSFV